MKKLTSIEKKNKGKVTFLVCKWKNWVQYTMEAANNLPLVEKKNL